jgi:hypothetical protein
VENKHHDIKRCSRCGEDFYCGNSKEKYRLCPDCIEKQAPTVKDIDAWQYMKKGVGYRLIAGFRLMKGE